MKTISGLTVLPLRAIDHLAKSPALGLRSPLFELLVRGAPEATQIL